MSPARIFTLITIAAIIVLITAMCSNGAKNYPNAQIVSNNNHTFIKLKGKRKLMVHDPISMFINKTYEDSILLQIPDRKNQTIHGSSIPVKKGYYEYRGDIVIKNNQVKIYLCYNDTDDKRLIVFDWNGVYNITNVSVP